MRTTAFAAGVLTLLAAASLGVAQADPGRALGCSQLNKMASVFPAAKRVGFIQRNAVKRVGARAPIWPGWCGRTSWWTTYTARKGSVEIQVALYATSRDVGAALAEPAYGPVQVLSNGSRVRTNGPAGVVSAYRNLFISSGSLSFDEPVPIAAQLRLHRAIEQAFRSL